MTTEETTVIAATDAGAEGAVPEVAAGKDVSEKPAPKPKGESAASKRKAEMMTAVQEVFDSFLSSKAAPSVSSPAAPEQPPAKKPKLAGKGLTEKQKEKEQKRKERERAKKEKDRAKAAKLKERERVQKERAKAKAIKAKKPAKARAEAMPKGQKPKGVIKPPQTSAPLQTSRPVITNAQRKLSSTYSTIFGR